MNQIKFSHDYPKLYGQTKARLIEVRYLSDEDINPVLEKYDTFWKSNDDFGYYPLPKGLKLQLIFVGDKNIPFCTIRRQTPEKEMYYRALIGEWFDILIEAPSAQSGG